MPPLQILLAELCYAIPMPSHNGSATEGGWVQKWAAGPAVLSALGLLPRPARSAVLQGSASLPGKEMQQAFESGD